MGVKVIKREYYNQFFPNTEKTDWLIGNVGDQQRLELTIESQVIFTATQGETVQIDSLNNTFTLNNGKKWRDYGFDIGDSITFSWLIMDDLDNDGTWISYPQTANYTIQNLYDSILETQEDFDYGEWEIMPTDRGNIKIKDVKFIADKEPEGIKFKYGHLTNDNFNSGNLISFIDGTQTIFSYAGLQNLPNNGIGNMNPDGMQSGMAIEKCQIQKLGANESASYLERYILGSTEIKKLFTKSTILPITGAVSKRDIDAFSIPLNRTFSTAGYQNQVSDRLPIATTTLSGVTYLSGISNRCMIFNNTNAGIKFFNIDFKFKITNTNENSNSDRVSLVLIKYKDGGSLNFKSRKELASWPNASSLENQVISFNGSENEDLQIGESLCLALEWYHLAQPTARFIDVQWIQSNVDVLDTDGVVQNGIYKYKIICDFMLTNIFEELSNLETLTAPSQLFDANSLTDNFEIEMFPEWNNPNTSIKNNLKHTERLGNTGWFNENFNGLDNNFKIESLKYYNQSGLQVDKLDFASPVIVEIKVSGLSNLNNDNEFGLGFSWIPINEEDYKNKQTPYHKNLLINTARKYEEGSFNLNENTGNQIFEGNSFAEPKMNITAFESVMFTKENNLAVLRAVFIPNAQFTQFFENKAENDRNYVLWVSVANKDLQINFSDRVSLLADYNTMEMTIPEAGPFSNMTNKFLEHPQNENANGVSNYYGHIEDDILSRVIFKTKKNIEKIIGVNFGFEVSNQQIDLNYVLKRISKNVSNIPFNANGIQEIVLNEDFGYKLVAGNNKNWVKINRKPSSDQGDLIAYECFFASKIRWEDWILKNAVPNFFFDSSKLNNGFHNNWLDYLRKNIYNQFFFFVELIIEENNSTKRYKNKFQIAFDGYDENDNIQTEHRFYRDSDNTLLNIGLDSETGKPLGVILQDEPTRLEILYKKQNGGFDINSVYSVTCIEIENGAGEMEFRQLSSVWLSEEDNPLKPIQGEDKLKLELIAPNLIKTICLVEPSLLSQAVRYKVTGRIGCWNEGTNEPPFGLYEERYQDLYE